jgi:hypothetical protein
MKNFGQLSVGISHWYKESFAQPDHALARPLQSGRHRHRAGGLQQFLVARVSALMVGSIFPSRENGQNIHMPGEDFPGRRKLCSPPKASIERLSILCPPRCTAGTPPAPAIRQVSTVHRPLFPYLLATAYPTPPGADFSARPGRKNSTEANAMGRQAARAIGGASASQFLYWAHSL